MALVTDNYNDTPDWCDSKSALKYGHYSHLKYPIFLNAQ